MLLAVAGVVLLLPAGTASAADGVPLMYDIDGDGRIDPSVHDTNGDGWLDQNVVVLAGSFAWLFDQNQDSRVDQYGIDGTADGRVDIWMFDSDQDGTVEATSYDAAAYPTDATVSLPPAGVSFTIAAAPFTVGDAVAAGLTDPCAFYNGVAMSGTNVSCVRR